MVLCEWPPAQLLIHGGGWQAAATHYGRWLRSVGVGARRPPRWFDSVHSILVGGHFD
jgi:hypothetical protein